MQMASSNDVGAFHSRKETNKGSSTTTTLDDKGEPLLRPAREREIRRQRSERREKSAFAKRGPKKKMRDGLAINTRRGARTLSLSRPFASAAALARRQRNARARAELLQFCLLSLPAQTLAIGGRHAHALGAVAATFIVYVYIFFFSSSLILNRVTHRSLRPRSKPRYPLHERSRPKSEGTFSIPHRSRNAPCSRARASDSAQAHF